MKRFVCDVCGREFNATNITFYMSKAKDDNLYFKLCCGCKANMPLDWVVKEMRDATEEELKSTKDYIKSISYVYPRWIPVTERLPKQCEYGEVLVTYIPSRGKRWATVIIAHYSDLMGIAKPSFHIGEVGKESFQNITKHVIAWMPLPEPYEESEE